MKNCLLSGLLLVAALLFSVSLGAQQKFSILGDSYSTFEGYVTPATNAVGTMVLTEVPTRRMM